MIEESSLDDDDDEGTESSVVNFPDDHWRIQQLKASFQHSVRHRCPLVIHGPPGSGRTSMTAAVSQFARSWLSSPHAVVAARVLGSSPASMTIEYVLSTICHQIAEVTDTTIPSHSIRFSQGVIRYLIITYFANFSESVSVKTFSKSA